ncbi:cysteine hydrolase family protein [Mycobacterium talmoniae]|uniref:Peroxyureidoacrylate/ureidoacrylate amidohydrolase RutB n=2 Tax=Mycobacterium talmoniae TaxID=1858794 RepID=A0A2S8BF96_9MYCO|nr:isochorismatase family cysteine hydrolase [Mycobacterium talmoniae]PQM45347.1 Peroxyureidoacrylate/ureidoacrylate amidohydrolase RutB [Mycobacterium talmoniae]
MTASTGTIETVDAVLVVDMQNSFLHTDGALYECFGQPVVNIPETIDANVRLVNAARAAKKPVVFTRHRFRPVYVDAGVMVAHSYRTVLDGALLAGTWDSAIVDPLEPRHEELVVDKSRMDGFYNTDLELILRGYSARRIAVAGVVTNACVETTTRSASMRDFDVTVLSDCCSTYSDRDQQNALEVLARYGFAKVCALAEFLTSSTQQAAKLSDTETR